MEALYARCDEVPRKSDGFHPNASDYLSAISVAGSVWNNLST